MSLRKTYTEEEKLEFLELAKEVGVARAIRELNYPSFTMAKKWAIQYNVELPLNALSQYANDMKKMYGNEEKLFAGQLGLDRVVERLSNEEELAGDELKKIADAYKTLLVGMNLVENKAMNISENRSNDGSDAAIEAMIEEQNRLNRMKEMEANDQL